MLKYFLGLFALCCVCACSEIAISTSLLAAYTIPKHRLFSGNIKYTEPDLSATKGVVGSYDVAYIPLEKEVYIIGTASDERAENSILRAFVSSNPDVSIRDAITIDAKDASMIPDFMVTFFVKSKFLFAEHLKFSNLSVHTINGNVYVFGYANKEEDLQRINYIVSNSAGAKRVFNYIELNRSK